ncbi:MAG: hypothetical protein ABIO55_07125 [Ginsengibacter sp.]
MYHNFNRFLSFQLQLYRNKTELYDYENDNTSLNFKDSDHYYSMNAHFSKNKTKAVEEYMDRRIGKRSNMSFVNSKIDGTIALKDHTTFYIKKYPGRIQIKLDKDENSYEAYYRIKAMCEGLKNVLTK